MEAAIERRGLLRSFLAPAPPSLAMERLWSSRMEAAIEALESTGMEAAFLSVVRAASCGTDCATARSSPALRRRLATGAVLHRSQLARSSPRGRSRPLLSGIAILAIAYRAQP